MDCIHEVGVTEGAEALYRSVLSRTQLAAAIAPGGTVALAEEKLRGSLGGESKPALSFQGPAALLTFPAGANLTLPFVREPRSNIARLLFWSHPPSSSSRPPNEPHLPGWRGEMRPWRRRRG